MLALFAGGRAISAPATACVVHLTIEVDAEVPRARGAAFLTTLIGNHPGYRLAWVGRQSASVIDVDLVGDGLDGDCRRVVDDLRVDSRILSVRER